MIGSRSCKMTNAYCTFYVKLRVIGIESNEVGSLFDIQNIRAKRIRSLTDLCLVSQASE